MLKALLAGGLRRGDRKDGKEAVDVLRGGGIDLLMTDISAGDDRLWLLSWSPEEVLSRHDYGGPSDEGGRLRLRDQALRLGQLVRPFARRWTSRCVEPRPRRLGPGRCILGQRGSDRAAKGSFVSQICRQASSSGSQAPVMRWWRRRSTKPPNAARAPLSKSTRRHQATGSRVSCLDMKPT